MAERQLTEAEAAEHRQRVRARRRPCPAAAAANGDGLIVAAISLAVIAIVFAFGEDIEAYYQAIEINGAGESRAPPARHLVFVAVTALLDDDHRFAAP